MSVDSRLEKLKKEVRGVILSCPRGLTIAQFLKDYKESIGRTFPFHELGYSTINDLLEDIDDVVRLNPGYGGSPSTLVPVINEKVNHINTMVARQKPTSGKFPQRSMPRRSILEEPEPKIIRKPIQLPFERKTNSYQDINAEKGNFNRSKENSVDFNGLQEKVKGDQYSNDYDDTRSLKSNSSYEESSHSRYSLPNSKNGYQSNQYSEDYYHDNNPSGYHHNSEADGYYAEDTCIENSDGFADRSDSVLENGMMNDDEFERPPTPGEVIITEKMKSNFRKLLAEYSQEGIPSSKFCKLYNEKFGVPLDYFNYGAKSFLEMTASLPDVFYVFQQRPQQWQLFDAHQPIPSPEHERMPYDISMNIAKLIQSFPKGLKKTDLIFGYKDRFKTDLDMLWQRFGFNSMDSFLQSCSTVEVVSFNGEEIVIPKKSCLTNIDNDGQNYPLPPVSEMPYLWGKHFNEDECDPSMVYQPFSLVSKNKLNYAKVFACDVLSPSSIWLQMDDQLQALSNLMLDLNNYYNKYEQKHMLSDYSLASINLICAVRFDVDKRWHRAKIISYSNSSDRVTVRYIDFGTESEVSISDICKLNKEFYKLPVQVVQASLYGVLPKPSDSLKPGHSTKWTQECNDFLYDLCFEKKFSIKVLEIDEVTPKLEVILIDENNALTVNDQMLAAGYAVSVGHLEECHVEERIQEIVDSAAEVNFSSMLNDSHTSRLNDDQRIRTPPGYSPRLPTSLLSSKKVTSAPSTCDRILLLREEGMELHKEVERLQKEIRHKVLEANVLEQIVCKHSHPVVEGFQVLTTLYQEQPEIPAHEEVACNNLNQEYCRGFIKEQSTSGTPPQKFVPAAALPQEPMIAYQQGCHQMMNPMARHNPTAVPELGYNHMQERHASQPPHMMHHLTNSQLQQHPTYASYPYQVSPNQQIPGKSLVGPPVVVQNQVPYMGPPMAPYAQFQQQHVVYPQNVGHWRAPYNQYSGMYQQQYRQNMYPTNSPSLRPNFNIPVHSSSSPQPGPADNLPTTAPLSSPLEEIEVVDTKPSAPSESEMETVLHIEPAEEVIPPEDEVVEVEEIKVEIPAEQTSPRAPPPRTLMDTSHLTKQMKEFEIRDHMIAPPLSNNWLDLFTANIEVTSSSTNSSPVPLSEVSEYPTQSLLMMKDEVEKSDEKDTSDTEQKNLDDDLTDEEPLVKKVVNHIMKICVQNIHGQSSNMLLVLVGDSVAVLLQQLFDNYQWDNIDNSYNEVMHKLQDDSKSLIYSISYDDHIPIFEKLRKDEFITDEDSFIYLVNLCDVSTALDIICPSEIIDLSKCKDMFEELKTLVLPVDEFWYKCDERSSQ